jgi:hypothetical protein
MNFVSPEVHFFVVLLAAVHLQNLWNFVMLMVAAEQIV